MARLGREVALTDLGEPASGDVEDVRVEARRVDQLGLDRLAELRLRAGEALDRVLEDTHGLGAAVQAEQRAAELEREPGVARPVLRVGGQ